MMKKVLIASVAIIVVLVGVGALLPRLESPTAAYARIQKHVQEGNWERVYGSLSSKTKEQLNMATAMADLHLKQAGVDPSKARLSTREKFARTMSNSKVLQALFSTPGYTVSSVEEADDQADITLTVPGEPQPRRTKMIRESGLWRLELDLSKPNKALQGDGPRPAGSDRA